MADLQELDVLVIGAGLSGIAFAKFYLDIHPECNLLMIDRDTCPGGSWNARRLYPGFWSQTGLDMAEFSDLTMSLPPGEPTRYSMARGRCVNEYLETYLSVHTYAGVSLRNRFRPNVHVETIDKIGGRWHVGTVSPSGVETMYSAAKVVMATGLTSKPNMPDLPDSSAFKGQIVHQESFGSSAVATTDSVQTVAVIGAGKSAADMVYACAKAGKRVHWLIRENGSGPPTFVGAEGKGSYRNSQEMSSTRLIGSASPSPYTPDNRRTKLMGRTVLGRTLMASVWDNIDRQSDLVFDSELMSRKDLQRLKQKASVFWNKSPPVLIQQPDFFRTLSENVSVHRASVTYFAQHEVALSDGQSIPCDALLLGTGWKHTHHLPFLPEQRLALGLPCELDMQTPSESAMWSFQHEDADWRLREKWPAVTNPPRYVRTEVKTTPYRLYKLIAPLNDPDRSIVFLGVAAVANAFRTAEAQAVWAAGYMDSRFELPTLEHQRKEIAEVNVWCRRRYLNNGVLGNYMYYDWLGYSDALLEQAGVLDAVKGSRSLWNWWTRPNLARDLRHAKRAYLERYEGQARPPKLLGKLHKDQRGDSMEVATISTERSFSISSLKV